MAESRVDVGVGGRQSDGFLVGQPFFSSVAFELAKGCAGGWSDVSALKVANATTGMATSAHERTQGHGIFNFPSGLELLLRRCNAAWTLALLNSACNENPDFCERAYANSYGRVRSQTLGLLTTSTTDHGPRTND